MAYKLILDFGNTLKKVAVFIGDEQVEFVSTQDDVISLIEALRRKYPTLDKAILSSVINIDIHLMSYLKANFSFVYFTAEISVPLTNNYHSPETLGRDRLASAVGASIMFPNRNLLVIDAGSSVTYDIITEKGGYLGGAISLGVQMRAKALNKFTDKLPLVNTPVSTQQIGNNTDTSLKSGIVNGAIAEMNGMIEAFLQTYDDLKIILTGGDAYYFDKSLKYDIFASENLVLKGLNYILDYNEH